MKRFIVLLILCIASFAFAEVKHLPGQYVTVSGAKLWVETDGKGEPLLLIPGGPGCSHVYFHPYFSTLSDSYRVIYFDAFGRGKSDRARNVSEYSFDRDVEDIEGLRKAMNLGQINLLGHSYGGMVAQAYAIKYPQSVRRLILSSTLYDAEMWQANDDNSNYEIKNQYPEVWEKLMKLRAQGVHSSAKEHQDLYGLIPQGLLYFYDSSNADKMSTEDGWINADVYYQIAGDDADFLISGDMSKIDFRTQLKNLKMPMLILSGRFDRVSMPKYSMQFQTYAPQAKYVMFEHSGHNQFIEEPELYFKTIREFLSK